MQIRVARKEDALRISEVTKAAFLDYIRTVGLEKIGALTETVEDIESDIANKIVLVCEAEGDVIACVRLAIEPNKRAYLSRFCVSDTVQGGGIGRMLLQECDNMMRDRGIREIYLHTASTHSRLVTFYYSNGFYIDAIDKSRGYVRATMKRVLDERS